MSKTYGSPNTGQNNSTSVVAEDSMNEYDLMHQKRLRAAEAQEILQKYKEGKQSIDARVTANQEWWRLRHWETIEKAKGAKEHDVEPSSAWLFNSIINKHADIMDNFPMPNILPREQQDEEEAMQLSKIVPVIMEQNKYDEVYSQAGYDLIIEGGFINSVMWDSTKNNGMGDIVIKNVDEHNLFWMPGITDIQDSDHIFYVALEDIETVKAMYPEHAERIGHSNIGTITEYIHDDTIDTANMCEVVDDYYKQTIQLITPIKDDQTGMTRLNDDGTPMFVTKTKEIVHYRKMVGDVELYCSEDDPKCEMGFYRHGKYPFVVKTMFPVKDSVWGFGYLDIMKQPQTYIDKLDQAILKNALMVANPRWWARKNADINLQEFADWSKPFVEVSGSADISEALRQIEVLPMPSAVFNQRDAKIEELKETSGNRDFSQGGTAQGITAASAIASLQEAGSKLARDVNKTCYRGTREVAYLVVELLRQFATEPRTFRIDDKQGGHEFEEYNSMNYDDCRRAELDIKIVAEKQSPFSQAAQNELAKEMYSLGWFNPDQAEPSLIALEMMEFEGKDKVMQRVQQNSTFMQMFQRMMQTISMADQMFPELQLGVQAGLVDPQQMMAQASNLNPQGQTQATQEEAGLKGTAEERAARKPTDTAMMNSNRLRAANMASV